MTATTTTTTSTTIDWAALAREAAERAAGRAAKATKAATPRAPGLASRFLTAFAATAPVGTHIPLTAAIAAWVAATRADGGDLGEGKTPEASVSSRVYTESKAGKLPDNVRLTKAGSTAVLTRIG